MRSITLPARDIPVIDEYDVIVAGGGPGGIPAAVAAARAGAKTLLVERYGYLGGMATAGLIAVILGTRASGTDEPMIGGIAEELCRRMADLDGAPDYDEAVARGGIPFDPEAFKLAADELVLAKVFVDATGDADVVARADAGFVFGRAADGAVQSMGSMFHIAGVEAQRLPTGDALVAFRERAAEAITSGEITAYNPSWGGVLAGRRTGHHMPNATRFAGDPTDVEDLTRGELQVRGDTWELMDWWRENVPGMEGAYIVQTPPHIGLRESRQMVGLDIVTGDDVVEARRRDDAVARCPYWIDIHCPLGRTKHNTHLCYTGCPNDPPCPMYEEHYEELPGDGSDDRKALYPRDGLWFDIPWGSLVSADIPNLLTAGRAISADHQAMSALRVMGTCMAIGEAAGEGAAMAADADRGAAAIDVPALQERLRANGAAV